MQKHEANFGLTFRSWFRANKKQFENSVFELKDTRGGVVFRLSEWKEKQRNNALACSSDEGVLLRFSSGTPGMADYGFYRNAYAYIVIKYPKAFYIINAYDLLNHPKKSLSETDAFLTAIHSVKLT